MALFDLPLEQLERYAPDVPQPADFDAFWRGTLEAADARPARPAPTAGQRVRHPSGAFA